MKTTTAMKKKAKSKKNLILVIDGENILHQSFHKFDKLRTSNGKPSGAIYGFFKSLHGYIVRFDPYQVYVTFDNGHSKLRDKLNPHYKEHRLNLEFDRESLINQKGIILKTLSHLRVPYIFDKKNINDYEGDDYVAYQSLKLSGEGNKVLIISSDKDFNQLLTDDNIKIFNPRKDEYITKDNCFNIFGYYPEETVDYLSIVGDGSDDIKGINGIGPVKARKLLNQCKDLDKFLQSQSEENYQILKRNRKLIDLRWFINNSEITKLPLHLKKSEPNLSLFKEISVEYEFNSFLTNQFINPFINLSKNIL